MFLLSIARRDPSKLYIPITTIARCQSHWLPRKRLSRTAMDDLRQLNSRVHKEQAAGSTVTTHF